MSVLYLEPREKASREECTRDPIFLLQVRRFHYPKCINDVVENYGYTFQDEGFVACYSDTGEVIHTEPDYVKDEELVEKGLIVDYWDTERVFFTRQEAEEWATARSYNYPNGWRVYCVCAEGVLIQVLEDGDRKRRREKASIKQMIGRFERDECFITTQTPLEVPVPTSPSNKKWWQK